MTRRHRAWLKEEWGLGDKNESARAALPCCQSAAGELIVRCPTGYRQHRENEEVFVVEPFDRIGIFES